MSILKNGAVAVIFAIQASISFADGNTLLSDCNAASDRLDGRENSGSFSAATSCLGFLEGMRYLNEIYSARLNKNQLIFCIPPKVTNGQLVRVAAKYLENNPARLHEHQVYLASDAFRNAFPCD
jgi:hypothetical protein